MYKESQFSIHDYLSKVRPDLYQAISEYKDKVVSQDTAKLLFELWSDKANKVSEKVYKVPVKWAAGQVEALQRASLIKNHLGKLLITSKGSEVIKVFVLGDDRSIFEDDGSIPDYKVAKAKTESPTRLRKTSIQKEDEFWSNLLK